VVSGLGTGGLSGNGLVAGLVAGLVYIFINFY
jgi:hypothetical protein